MDTEKKLVPFFCLTVYKHGGRLRNFCFHRNHRYQTTRRSGDARWWVSLCLRRSRVAHSWPPCANIMPTLFTNRKYITYRNAAR